MGHPPNQPKDLEQINSELNAALRDTRTEVARLKLALRTTEARLRAEQVAHREHHRSDPILAPEALPFDEAPPGEEAEL
jgi:hypothetical protein